MAGGVLRPGEGAPRRRKDRVGKSQPAAERTDPVLFGLSYDYVGDLSETVALMWPTPSPQARRAPSPACRGLDARAAND